MGLRLFGRRRHNLHIFYLAIILCISLWWLGQFIIRLFPSPPSWNLHHFRVSRKLDHYLDDMDLLVEPPSPFCERLEEVPLVVLVSSAPTNEQLRNTIRSTWGRFHPTYFFLGLHPPDSNEVLVGNYIEAKKNGDMVVFDFLDDVSNQTLKTGAMMKWIQSRCSHAEFFLKVHDDVLVNPWTLKKVLTENRDEKLIGYKVDNTRVQRNKLSKDYIPEWLYAGEYIPEYLSGSAYLINGDYFHKLYNVAQRVTLLNLEDIYFTYILGKRTLGYSLKHDSRLSPYRPLLGFRCSYWLKATIHGLTPIEMANAWSKIVSIANTQANTSACSFYGTHFSGKIFL